MAERETKKRKPHFRSHRQHSEEVFTSVALPDDFQERAARHLQQLLAARHQREAELTGFYADIASIFERVSFKRNRPARILKEFDRLGQEHHETVARLRGFFEYYATVHTDFAEHDLGSPQVYRINEEFPGIKFPESTTALLDHILTYRVTYNPRYSEAEEEERNGLVHREASSVLQQLLGESAIHPQHFSHEGKALPVGVEDVLAAVHTGDLQLPSITAIPPANPVQ